MMYPWPSPARRTRSPSASRSRRDPASVGLLTTAVGTAGGVVTALDVTESHADRIVIDVTCAASDQAHSERLTEALGRSTA